MSDLISTRAKLLRPGDWVRDPLDAKIKRVTEVVVIRSDPYRQTGISIRFGGDPLVLHPLDVVFRRPRKRKS